MLLAFVWPQIYLNPDNDAVWAEKESADYEESAEAIETARSLLYQVCGRGKCLEDTC